MEESETIVQSLDIGMGSIIKSDKSGVTFRVWAPHAAKISVVGDFNDWDESKDVLAHEENGYWACFVAEAKERQEYKFAITHNEETFFRNDPYAKEVTNSNGNSIICSLDFDWKCTDFKMPDWNELVVYELHIGTFYRGEDKDSVGTFYDAIKRLPYLKALGINCIEILPIAEFAGDISWGYNPSSPFAVETDYGGAKGFAKFVDEAHLLGIAVINDVVYNHFGPSDLDLWRFDGWGENDKGGIYFYNDHRSDTPWGDTRPDYGRPEVRQYIRDNAIMWLEDYKCDGLRWDATSYIRDKDGGIGYTKEEIYEGTLLMQNINTEIHDKYPGRILIAEDLKGDHNVTSKYGDKALHFDTQWDGDFVHPIKRVLTAVDDNGRNLDDICKALFNNYNDDAFQRTVFTESHDEVANGKSRIPEEIQPGEADSEFAKKRSILGGVLTLTAPGIPMIFQGQEFLEDEYFVDTEELDWSRFSEFKGITKLYRDLIKLRSTPEELGSYGLTGHLIDVVHFNNETKVLAYTRTHQDHLDKPVLVILNFSSVTYHDYKVGSFKPDDLKTVFNSTWEGYDNEDFETVATGLTIYQNEAYDGCEHTLSFSIDGYGALIVL
ncbi:alpha-amylase family glycosyl hydrolase [Wenyingzhuangia sp. IMCC45533]